jgi:alanine racemase
MSFSLPLSSELHGGPCAVIDRVALRHNLAVVRATAPHSKIMAVVKANAYGHGIVPVARSLLAADGFGVARLKEAVALRDAGIGQAIVLLEGVFSHHDLNVAAVQHLDVVVHSPEQLQLLLSWNNAQRLNVWCKVDTGMNRLGFHDADFGEVWRQLLACPHVDQLRVMTHLADADNTTSPRTPAQLARFARLSKELNVERSIGNSAGLIAWPEARVEWVRPGLMMYGMSPFEDRSATQLSLQPVMTLVAPLIAIRSLRVGEEVGYGGTWCATRDSRVGIVAAGYGDGYPRHARTGTPVRVCDQIVPLIGRVSMDMIAIDLNACPQAEVGERVILWGEGLPAEQVAKFADTIAYELVCAISQRVAMRYE